MGRRRRTESMPLQLHQHAILQREQLLEARHLRMGSGNGGRRAGRRRRYGRRLRDAGLGGRRGRLGCRTACRRRANSGRSGRSGRGGRLHTGCSGTGRGGRARWHLCDRTGWRNWRRLDGAGPRVATARATRRAGLWMRSSRRGRIRRAAYGRRGSFSGRGSASYGTGRRRRHGGGGRLCRQSTACLRPSGGGLGCRRTSRSRSRIRRAARRRGGGGFAFGHRPGRIECGNAQHGAELQKTRVAAHECRWVCVEDRPRGAAKHGPVVRPGGCRGDIRQRLPRFDRDLRRSRSRSRRSA